MRWIIVRTAPTPSPHEPATRVRTLAIALVAALTTIPGTTAAQRAVRDSIRRLVAVVPLVDFVVAQNFLMRV